MPDPEGNITAGDANVATPGPTPVAPDIGATPPIVPGAAPDIGSRTASSLNVPARPPSAQPSFFRQLLFSLGKGLIEGTKAGLQAPLGPQGPAIAAQTAIQAPQKEQERLNQQQLDQLKVETAQVNLAILHHTLTNVADERVEGYYKSGQKYANDLIEKGGAESAGTGSQADIHKLLLQKKDTDPDATYMAFPNPGSSRGGDDEYTLLKIDPKGYFDEDVPTQTIKGMTVTMADGSEVTYPDVTIPGAKKGTRIDAYNARITPMLKMAGLKDTDLTRLVTTQAQQAGATRRAQLGADVRLRVAELNNITRRAIADQKIAQDAGDKQKVQALGKLVTAAKAFGDAQGKIGNKAWDVLTGAETKELKTKRAALDAAKAEYDAVSKKPTITPTGKVPKGTVATKDVLQQYLQKAGGNKDVARTNLTNDGYTIPPRQGQAQ